MNIKIIIILIFILIMIFLIGCNNYNSANKKNIVVSLDDNGDFSSIQDAINSAKAGDKILIKAGTYYESIKIKKSATQSDPIVIKNYANDKVVINGSKLKERTTWGGLIEISHSSYIFLSGLEVQHSNNSGILVENSNNIIIENIKSYDTTSSGIGVWESSAISIHSNEIELACNDGEQECITIAISNDVNVTNNEVHHNGKGTNGGEGIDIKEGSFNVIVKRNHVHHLHGSNRPALYADAWDKHTYNILFDSNKVHDIEANAMAIASEMGGLLERVTFVNNIIYDSHDGGFIVGGWTEGGQVVKSNPVEHINIINNTFYNVGGDGIYIGNQDAKDVYIINNIIQNTNKQELPIYIQYTPLSEVNISNNLIDSSYESYGQKSDIIGNPLFVDAIDKNFHLLSTSPAINVGVKNDFSQFDYDGNRRNQAEVDIGAYEFKN